MAKQTNNPVTKQYLDKKLDIFGKKLKTELKTELKKELREELREDLYEIKDEIVGEIKAMREENDIHHVTHERVDDMLDEHDERIAKLELKTKI